MKYIAHRGYSFKALENTKEAFIYASQENGFIGSECDIRLTKDNIFVVFHDEDFNRLANNPSKIIDLSLKEVKSIKMKEVYTVPTLEEYLTILSEYNKKAIIEVKIALDDNSTKKLLEETKHYFHNIIFISFIYDNLVLIRKYEKDIMLQYLRGTYAPEVLDMCLKINCALDIRGTELDKIEFSKYKEAGVEINIWTIDDENFAKKCEEKGVDYLTSNKLHA